MRLIKQAMEPKDRLVRLYECMNPWPCYAKPGLILHDRGKIFTSERATQVLVDRFKITSEQTPPFTPSANGTAEAIFAWMTRKFEHRMPGTTKANPEDRGAYDSLREAEKAGITLDLLEKYFIQAIVDDYMQDVHGLRRQTPIVLWQYAVQEKGVSRWQGSNDDLKLLLMKSQNRKNPATGRYALKPHQGLSFLGRRYNNGPLLKQLRGKEIDIYYDRRDISVIYIFEKGELRGEAFCTEFPAGRRVSLWEADKMRKADKKLAKRANAVALEGRQRIQEQARASKKIHSLERVRLERQRQYDQQRSDIHPDHVQVTLNSMTQNTPPASQLESERAKPRPLPEPEDDMVEVPVIHLPIRRWEKRDE
jgi:putative transposase